MNDSTKNFIKENWFKLAIIATTLVFAYVVYYAFVKIPSQKADMIKEQQRQEQLIKESNQAQLDSCLSDAETNYVQNWATACKIDAKRVSVGYSNCVSTGLDATSCRSIWGYPNANSDCSLPKNNADSVNGYREQDKDNCYRRYPVR